MIHVLPTHHFQMVFRFLQYYMGHTPYNDSITLHPLNKVLEQVLVRPRVYVDALWMHC